MRFSTVGSYFLDDIIFYGKNNVKKDYDNVGRYTCINPISLCFGYQCTDDEADEFLMRCENKYQQRMHRTDLRKTCFHQIKSVNPDYILFDFSEIFSPVKVYEANGRKIAFTYHGYLSRAGEVAVKEQILSYQTLSPQGILNYAKAYVERLIEQFGKEKLILVETRFHYQYFDKDGKWTLVQNVADLTAKNEVLARIDGYIEREFNIKTITMPEILVNDLSLNANQEFKLAPIYYQYAVDCLSALLKGKSAKAIEAEMPDRIEEFIDEKTMQTLVVQAKVNGIDKGKKLALIGHSKPLERMLKEQYNASFAVRIEYSRNTTDEALYAALAKLQGKASQYHIIVPHLYRGSKAIRVFLKRMLILSRMAFFRPGFRIRNLFGEYYDIYNNHISSRHNTSIVDVFGQGISVYLGKSNRRGESVPSLIAYDQAVITIEDNVTVINTSRFCAYWTSEIEVKSGCSFGADELTAYSCGSIKIGENCMFAKDVIVQAGDGHGIYDLRTEQNINSDPSRFEDKCCVSLGRHVWVGREAFLINCKIADGSIVGARALVKKSWPNNCVIAGVPAKIVRKDIAWVREINCYDIDDPELGVPKEDRNFTQE